MKRTGKGIMSGLTILGRMGWLTSFTPLSLATSAPAPEITSPTWLNSEPLTWENLRGEGGDGGVLDLRVLELPEHRTLCNSMA